MTWPAILPVYVIHWHAPDWCRSTVESLLASRNVSTRVQVLNNGGILDVPVPVADMPRNLGYAGAANVALQRSRRSGAEFCVLAAHDLHVEPDTLEKLVAAAVAGPDLGILGPELSEPKDERSLHGERVGSRCSGVVEYDWIAGTCLLLRQECVDEIGGFDTIYGSYVEEVDLCVRARGAGWKVGVVAGALAHGLGPRHPARAAVLSIANFAVLEAKTGQYGRVARRLAGLGRRAAYDQSCRKALPLALWKLAVLAARGAGVTAAAHRRAC